MTDQNNPGLRKIRRALISVSDKTGIVDFARELKPLRSRSSAPAARQDAARGRHRSHRRVQVTGFPEMMDGRVKTLHPKIHGGLLGVRDNPAHIEAMREHSIEPIDMVVVNLYPFEQTVMGGATMDEAIEQIDIGGPAMIRSAAKNFRDVAVIVSSYHLPAIAAELKSHDGALSETTRLKLARYAFSSRLRTTCPSPDISACPCSRLAIRGVSELGTGIGFAGWRWRLRVSTACSRNAPHSR
jgi:phosphoribosylaminoimidazolecarboxamide formyltransferase/IMP cyclohydrolase